MNQETKVGMFLLVAIGVIMASAVMLGDISLFGEREHYYADFRDVQALPPKAAVKVSGVEIGKVIEVNLVDMRARVTIAIDPDVTLYENASARIGSTGIIGSRFVELIPGTVDQKVLPPKSIIEGQDGADLNDMVKKFGTFFEEDDEYGNPVQNLKATIANLRKISDSLREAVGDRSGDIVQIVENVKELTDSARVFTADIEDITQSRKEDVKVALKKFRDIGDKLDAILAKIQDGEGTIGTLVSDEKTAGDVKEAVASIKDTANQAKEVLGKFNRVNTYWNYRYRYDFRDEESRSDVGVTVIPSPGKYYAVGVTNLGERPDSEKTTKYERVNRLTAVIGADYGPFTGYAGAIRSKGGVGLNFRPFWWSKKWSRRVELNVEASDFDRNRIVNGQELNKTLVMAGGHVAVLPWLWVGARGEDLLERGAFMGYTNIVFRDKDLSYLLGWASFSR